VEDVDVLNAKGEFEVAVSSPDLKFSCAHFVAYRGFRERLHGHNYSLSVRAGGMVGHDGYVVDFGVLKKAAKVFCQELNEHFIVPMKSDVLKIVSTEESVLIETEDGSEFKIPKDDCILLPIVHATAEEIAFFGWHQLLKVLSVQFFKDRCISWMEVSVFEKPTQEARYKRLVE